jgi:hypothetical protein
MSLTYTIRAGDGQEYGPATLEQLTVWAGEGRVNRETELQRSDMQHWAPAGGFTELQPVFPPEQPAAPPELPAAPVPGPLPRVAPATNGAADPATRAQLKSGAGWFYWIAGLSLVNSIAAVSGTDWRFILGLGVTQVIDVIGEGFGGGAKVVCFGLDLVAAAVLVMFGIFGNKGHLWAFIVGMVLLALDSLVFLIAQDWLGVGFHAFVLFCLFRGLQACRALRST